MDPQEIVTGRVGETRFDGEAVRFTHQMGLFETYHIVNLPKEGDERAPVFIHFKRQGAFNVNGQDPQMVRTAKLKTTRTNGETLVYSLEMGPYAMIFIVNIPPNNQEETPVIVIYKMNDKFEEFTRERESGRDVGARPVRRTVPEVTYNRRPHRVSA